MTIAYSMSGIQQGWLSSLITVSSNHIMILRGCRLWMGRNVPSFALHVYPWMLGAMWALNECFAGSQAEEQVKNRQLVYQQMFNFRTCPPEDFRHHSFPWSTGSSCCHTVASMIHLIHNRFDLVTSAFKRSQKSLEQSSKSLAWFKQILVIWLYQAASLLLCFHSAFPFLELCAWAASNFWRMVLCHPLNTNVPLATWCLHPEGTILLITPTILLEMAQMKPSCEVCYTLAHHLLFLRWRNNSHKYFY